MSNFTKKRQRFLNWKTLLGIVVSFGGIYLGFRRFDGQTFLTSLKETDLWLFGMAMLVMVIQVFLRAVRWHYLLRPLKRIPLRYVFGSQMVCYFGNYVFPLRFGEILRTYALNSRSGLSMVSIFGTVVVERLLDVIFFLILFPVTIMVYAAVWPHWVRWSGIVAAGLMLLIILLIIFFRKSRDKVDRFLTEKLGRSRFGTLVQPLQRFLEGLRTLQGTPHLTAIVVMTLVIWVVSILNVWVAGLAVHVFFSFQNLLLLFFVTSAIIAVPSAPGYVGTYHAGAIGILLYMGFPLSQAQVIAVILHAVGFIALTSIGCGYFLKYHLHVRDVASDTDNKELIKESGE